MQFVGQYVVYVCVYVHRLLLLHERSLREYQLSSRFRHVVRTVDNCVVLVFPSSIICGKVLGMPYVALVLCFLLVSSVAAQDNPYADCCESYCFRADENPYLLFATKTAYEFVYGKSSNNHLIPYCKPVLFWSFNRHGSRYPNPDIIKSFETLQKLKETIIKNYESPPIDTGRLCDEDLDTLRRWRWNQSITESAAYELTQQGRDDMKFLAKRYQTRYPVLLREPYSNHNYQFQYTNTDRTRSSYEAFADGLFGSDVYKSQAQPMGNEITRSYKDCNAWIKNVKENPDTKLELEKFKERDEYKRVVAHVSRRLGFRYTLNETLIKTMYDICRYEKAWYVGKYSAWCIAFTKEHLKVLEYGEDLKYYYKTGYGHQINQKLGCTYVKDMMDRFERVINGDRSQPRVVVQFTHTSALQLLMVSLGIHKDNQPLTAENMRLQQRRLWRSSTMTPFSANLVAVLYECNEAEKYRVMFFLNEKPVDYPGCAVGLCTWTYLKNQLQDTVSTCNLDFCDQSSAVKNFIAYPLIILNLLIPFLYRY